jgi:hypothetical protein
LDLRSGVSTIFLVNLLDARRRAPRISVDGFCSVATDRDDLHHASLSDLSTLGLQLESAYDPATPRAAAVRPVVQLEIELPGLDEIVWTSAVVTRVYCTRIVRGGDGRSRFWYRAGLRIGETSRHDRRMLHDYVIEKLVAHRAAATRGDRRSECRS